MAAPVVQWICRELTKLLGVDTTEDVARYNSDRKSCFYFSFARYTYHIYQIMDFEGLNIVKKT